LVNKPRRARDWAADCYLKLQESEQMPLITIVITLVVIGVVLWLINSFIPMASSIKTLLNVVVVVCTSVWLLQVFGLWGRVTHYRFH
jgi:hypothetical protein